MNNETDIYTHTLTKIATLLFTKQGILRFTRDRKGNFGQYDPSLRLVNLILHGFHVTFLHFDKYYGL